MDATCEKLRILREKSGLRQNQIAGYLNVTQTFISKVENGERNLTVDQLEKLLCLYGYSLSSFCNFEQDFHPIQFAFRALDVNQEDLKAIADISKIVTNLRFMSEILEESNFG